MCGRALEHLVFSGVTPFVADLLHSSVGQIVVAASVAVLQVSARKETALSVMVTGFRQQTVASSWSKSLPKSMGQQVRQEFLIQPDNDITTR